MAESSLADYLSGLVLGLTMIVPIGPQNLFILTQGLRAGMRGALLAVAAAGFCDTVLIVSGAAGLSAVSASWLFFLLLAAAGAFFRARLTPRWMQATQWVSAAVMILFALGFAVEAGRWFFG